MGKKKGRVYECDACGKDYEPYSITQLTCSRSCASSGTRNGSYKHGHLVNGKRSKTLSIWYGMRARVNNPKEYHKKYYKNIKICQRWDDFNNFLEDMGECPSEKHSIDRIDVYGDYEPSNCRWATHTQQMNNTTSNRVLTLNGVSMTQEQWGRKLGMNGAVIYKRLKRGWSVERSLTTPLTIKR